MLKDEVANALIIQLNKEFQSSYIYLGMSAYASKKGLAGCANWFLIQYQEELTHAMKFFKYLENHQVAINLPEIKKANVEFESILDAFQKALEHEIYMSENINELSDLSMKNKDHATYNLLQWYVTEQVEEEVKVVRTKQVDLKPMDIEEAVLQLELLGHDFFIYTDAKDGKTNVLYKREEGDLGLLEVRQ